MRAVTLQYIIIVSALAGGYYNFAVDVLDWLSVATTYVLVRKTIKGVACVQTSALLGMQLKDPVYKNWWTYVSSSFSAL